MIDRSASDDLFVSVIPETRAGRWVQPVKRFLEIESSGGIILLTCTLLAIAIANSPWGAAFEELWHLEVSLGIGAWELREDLRHVVNDGLMTIFFFVVGLEMKREIVAGQLRRLRDASLPIAAAIGGMVVPVLVFQVVAGASGMGETDRRGWAIPMATDIAFVVGVLTLFGPRVPFNLRVLLLTLAIVDDLGAVLVIAAVFTEHILWNALVLTLMAFIAAWVMRWVGVRAVTLYVVVGIVAWYELFVAGVHPTIAGVVLGLMTPSHAWISNERLREAFDRVRDNLPGQDHPARGWMLTSRQIRLALRENNSPLERLETALHPWVAFVIVPLFALANAGVAIDLSAIRDPLVVAIAAGLVIGKPLGILAACGLARVCGVRLPAGVSWGLLAGGACLAGIGFTMSLFLAGLALPATALEAGKLGTLIGSLISGALGATLLLLASRATPPALTDSSMAKEI